ncbi:MAG: 2-keto-4-pentenoate hydratase [Chloroflexi bacterium]|jgi:2-keto-4-pentenoate hydratase|nr:MAG: 2-keto-4-pentenoate hydratase [Chloroflexota bacterium]
MMTNEAEKSRSTPAVDQVAGTLWEARTFGGLAGRDAADGLHSTDNAYQVQWRIETLAEMPRVGWKVGATSKVAQDLLGTDGPATAPMFTPFCHQSPAEVAIFTNHHINIESEFAFRFGRSLPPRQDAYTREEVLEAVDVLVPAIEIVGCRFEGGFAGIGPVRLIADMVAHAGFVSGPDVAGWREMDVKALAVRLSKNGVFVAEGTGASVLGDPLYVLEWTANHLSQLGQGIAAGEVITTGTCTGLTPAAPGDHFVADFGTLGQVELRITGA